MEPLKELFPLNPGLTREVNDASTNKELPENTVILREGQYITVIPVVLQGLIKVFTRHEDRELLLYYIRPNESCIMSFSAGLRREPSKVFAVTEEDTSVLLLPVDRVRQWTKEYPDINSLFFQQYNLRYMELLGTIHDVLFEKMDKRLYDYLKEKIILTNSNPLKISHRKIAGDMGTAREVISRVMKKLENEGKIKQHSNSIELL
ncbi:Crp/Fnr family transcriptional regulator [Salinimicrobium sp. TH3]|uniref:Crp/Fnr family transcriptional regulator n=1 Tax=Salinimicrobium sp. TH3 TaxID=2997342 RepID=UPI002272491B|nr:Crp/Fnr family transcriptional regulator [Salinimicrobium sp. TH3]MCY2685734.1 Crp/Fnr family transcriptional regulator [Salinimicrobium sp. TH3]